MSEDRSDLPRFIADQPAEPIPYGRLAELLNRTFLEACQELDDLPQDAGRPARPAFFPERRWGGRVWVPVTAREKQPGQAPIEYTGHVSFIRPHEGEPRGFRASADWTDETAEHNPDWQVDVNDDVIGTWLGPGGATADIAIVWGEPQVPGGTVAVAELGGEVVDQVEIEHNRFTLVAPDAIDLPGGERGELVIRVLGRDGGELASESLFEDGEPSDEGPDDPADGNGEGE